MSIGDNLKKIRKEKKLTQQALAEEMEISRSYLSDVENNRYNPSSKTLESFAKKLNVTMFYLTTGKKTIKDLSEDELKDVINTPKEKFKESINRVTIEAQSQLKDDFNQLLNSEMDYTETMYLVNMITYLKHSDSDDIIRLSAVVSMLNSSINYNKSTPDSKEELKKYIDGEMEFIRELLEKRFNYKEGD